mgnify:CR=1 FL=1
MTQCRRRQFLIASGAMLAAPFARAQPARRFRIGALWSSNEPIVRPLHAAFVEALREYGYVLERNLTLDVRYAHGDQQRLVALADELVALKPDVLAAGTDGVGIAMRRKTTAIPPRSWSTFVPATPSTHASGSERSACRRSSSAARRTG